jgi:hypothetical protein
VWVIIFPADVDTHHSPWAWNRGVNYLRAVVGARDVTNWVEAVVETGAGCVGCLPCHERPYCEMPCVLSWQLLIRCRGRAEMSSNVAIYIVNDSSRVRERR